MGVRRSMWLWDKYKNECGIEWEKWIGIEGKKNGLWANPRLNRVDMGGKGWNGSGRIIFMEIGGWRAKKEGISLEKILVVVWNVIIYGNRLQYGSYPKERAKTRRTLNYHSAFRRMNVYK